MGGMIKAILVGLAIFWLIKAGINSINLEELSGAQTTRLEHVDEVGR